MMPHPELRSYWPLKHSSGRRRRFLQGFSPWKATHAPGGDATLKLSGLGGLRKKKEYMKLGKMVGR